MTASPDEHLFDADDEVTTEDGESLGTLGDLVDRYGFGPTEEDTDKLLARFRKAFGLPEEESK